MLFITGGTGAIGGPLVAALIQDSSPLLLLARDPFIPAQHGINIVKGDVERAALGMNVTDAAFVRAHATTIIHAAARVRFGSAETRTLSANATKPVLI